MSYDVLQGSERWLDAVLTAQANGIDAVTNATYQDVVVRYRKEGAVASVLKTLASGATDWINQDAGVYRVRFTGTELNTLGSLTYSVVLAVVYACTEFMPYYGHVEIVSGNVTTITTNLTTVGNNVLGVSGDVLILGSQITTVGNNVLGVSGDVLVLGSELTTVGNNVLEVSGDVLALGSELTTVGNNVLGVSGEILSLGFTLQTSIEELNNYQIGAGAYYDSDVGSLTASLVLHKNGEAVVNPTSATVTGYDEDGTQIFTDTSVGPDAQGVFKFVETVVLAAGTVPYIKGTIVDVDGTHHTVTLTPVVV